ncbi:MAG: transcription termination/antitermination protein NusA [Candidatus Coatesbacteria bacterium]|nr:MAG: transcription termination/antitermination protein NusA [Candidatus Coatesbacteria bacterium]
MDEFNVMSIIENVARAKGVEQSVVVEALEAALTSASKRSHLNIPEMEVHILVEDDEAVIVSRRKVVDEVVWPGLEISLEEAREVYPDAELDDELDLEISPSIFGRNAAQIAKQVVIQRIREAEREIILEEYQDRVGEVVTGAVKRETKGRLIVDLGRTEAIMPYNHRIPGEDYRIGDRIRALLLEVKETPKGPQIVLSRSTDEFLVKLFEMEVPEIYEGIVSIVGVARESGSRSKIAVRSTDSKVDPVGTCVGMRGYRVQAVVRELSGEKVDIVRFSESIEELTRNALSPAQITAIEVDYDNQEIIVVVPENQLSLAIGKNGQNVRLAARLVGWRLDIYNENEREELRRKEAEEAETALAFLTSLPGIGESLAEAMFVEGFLTAEDILSVEPEELTEVPGIGLAKAKKLQEASEEYLVEAAARAAEEAAAEAARLEEEAAAAAETTEEGEAEEQPEPAEAEEDAVTAEEQEPREPVEAGDEAAEADEETAVGVGDVADEEPPGEPETETAAATEDTETPREEPTGEEPTAETDEPSEVEKETTEGETAPDEAEPPSEEPAAGAAAEGKAPDEPEPEEAGEAEGADEQAKKTDY